MSRVHHTAICTTAERMEDSLRFWRAGLGFEVTMDERFTGDWRTLFGAPSDELRSIFLGDPAHPSAGIVELVDLGPVADAPRGAAPAVGFFLVSVYAGGTAQLDAALARLGELGLGGEPQRIEVHGVAMAVVQDPNGVRVELIGLPA